jgi:hypothetical protein
VINLISNEPGIVKEFSRDEAIDIISEELFKIDEFYKNYYAETNKQLVTFYIWQAGGTELTHGEIEKSLSSIGGQTTHQNIQPEELIVYLKKNPEKAELITRISIDLDSYATRELGQALSRGDFGRLD